MTATQSSTLLGELFGQVDQEQRVTVLHIGHALPETVDFFSRYRCKLHFVDLFSELPIVADEDAQQTLQEQFGELMQFEQNTRFDVCLFWDLFNFLDRAAIAGFLGALRPHLHSSSMAHGFVVHNPKAPQCGKLYGISQLDALKVRNRAAMLPGYAPHPQNQLKSMLNCFHFEHSVLLPDSRLELLLSAAL